MVNNPNQVIFAWIPSYGGMLGNENTLNAVAYFFFILEIEFRGG